MAASTTVTLINAIKTHDGETFAITLKEPKARSFFESGEPFKMRVITDGETDRVDFEYDHKVLSKFLQDMSGLDIGVLSGIAASDYFAVRMAATNLIIGVAGTSPF